MYKQLKKQVEQEKSQFQKDLQKIQAIKKTPRVYQVYQQPPPKLQSSIQQSTNPKQQILPPQTVLQPEPEHQFLEKIKQLTDIKRFDKIAKLNSQLDQLKLENDQLKIDNQGLRNQLQESFDKIKLAQSQLKQALGDSEQKFIKLHAQESTLRSLVMELTAQNQEKQSQIVAFEAQRYEFQLKLEQKQQNVNKLVQYNDSVKANIQNILSNIKQLNNSLTAQIEQNKKEFLSLISESTYVLENSIEKQSQIEPNISDPGIDQQVSVLQSSLNSIIALNKLQHKEISALNHLITQTLTTSINYQKELQEKNNELQRKNAKLRQIQAQLSSLMTSQKQATQAREKQKQNSFSKIRQLQEMSQKMSIQLSSAGVKVIEMQNQLDQRKKAEVEDAEIIKGLKELLNRSTNELEHQKAQAQEKEKRMSQSISQLNTSIQLCQQTISEQQLKIQGYIQGEKALRDEIKQFQQAIKIIEAKDGQCSPELLQQQKILTTEDPLKRHKSQIAQQQIASLENEIQLQKHQSSQLQQKVTNLTFGIHEIQLQKTQLENRIQQQNLQLQALNELKQKQKQQIQQLQQKIKEINLGKQQLYSQNEAVKIKLSQNEAILASLKEETMKMYLIQRNNEQLKTKNIELIAQLQELAQREQINQLNQLQSKLNRQKEQANTKVALIQSQVIRFKKEIEILTAQLKTSKETEVDQRIILEQHTASSQEAINAKKTLQDEKQLLEKQLKDLQQKHGNLEQKYMKMEDQKISVCKQLAQKQEKCQQLRNQNDSIKIQFNELQEKQIDADKKTKDIQRRSERTPQKHKQDPDYLLELCQNLTKICRNCLKNNCDSVGLINIQLSKASKETHHSFPMLSSPTDLLRFNEKESSRQVIELQLQQTQKSKGSAHIDSKAESGNIHSKPDISPEDSDHVEEFEMKKEKKQLVTSRKTNKSSQDHLMKQSQQGKKVRSSQILEPKIKECELQRFVIQRTNPQQSANSLENNPDLEYPALPYPTLLQKYNSLKNDIQNMQEYINKVNNFNSKIKKSIAEVDHYAKFKTIDKISEKFTILVKNNESTLNNESLQFVTEITTILSELQNYIHFIDHLSKIQPFADYSKQASPFNRLKKQKTILTKAEKQKQPKKTYSQGESREDDLFEHFDTNICEYEDFNGAQYPRKDISKKQLKDIERYFDENKELYSQISSVKNKSLHSHNSFMNSKSQLEQLGMYLKNKMNQQHEEEDYHRIEAEDIDKIGTMGIDKVKSKYYRLKQKNRSLMIEKALLEQANKKLELQENTYKMKMNKMIKEFNDSFALFCKVSGQHLRPSPSRPGQSTQNREIQVEPNQLRRINKFKSCEIMSFSVENEAGSREDLESKIKEKEKVVREKEVLIQSLKMKLKNQQKQFREILIKVKEDRMEPLAMALSKNSQEFCQFMKKIASKARPTSLTQPVIQTVVEQRTPTFRKSQNYFKEAQVQPVQPLQQNQKKILQKVAFILNIRQRQQFIQNMDFVHAEQLLNNAIIDFKKKIYLQVVETVTDNISRLSNFETEYERSAKIQEYRQQLSQYLGNGDKINDLIKSANNLVKKLSRESITSVDNLSINSLCEDRSRKFISEKDLREECSNLQVHRSFNELKDENQKLQEKVIELQQQLQSLKQSNTSRDMVIHWQEEQIKQLKHCKQALQQKNAQLISFQKEKNSLIEELSKLKEKSHKKPKLFYVGH